jgi:hypothetical protein
MALNQLYASKPGTGFLQLTAEKVVDSANKITAIA